MSGKNTINVTESTFGEEVLQSGKPVLVDFWADWCGPCKMIAPVLEEIAEEHQNSVKVAKVNVDENPNLANHFGISAIPTMVLFEGGKFARKIVGFSGKEALLTKLGLTSNADN